MTQRSWSRVIMLSLGILFAIPLLAQESGTSKGPTDAEVDAAVQRACELILAGQERYDAKADLAQVAERRRPPNRGGNGEPDPKAAPQKTKSGPKNQEPGVEWPYEGVYRVRDGTIPPGYRVGGTAICCLALLEAPGFDEHAERKAALQRGLSFVMEMLEKEPLMDGGFLGTYDVRGWGHAYALSFFLRAIERNAVPEASRTKVRAMAQRLIEWLKATAIAESGGWNYSRSGRKSKSPASTFMTAPTLLALFKAKSMGFDVDPKVVERALQTLEEARLESGAFQYGTDPKSATGKGFEDVAGACARMAVCELVLQLAGKGSVERVRGSVDAFFTHWEWLEKRRKQTGTHIPPYMIAPYYFHFGHTYAAMAIELLPEAERPALRGRLRELYWKTRENDGGWNDRVFDRSQNYGCAMAILGLIAKDQPAQPGWKK